jgi:hypothetical protein
MKCARNIRVRACAVALAICIKAGAQQKAGHGRWNAWADAGVMVAFSSGGNVHGVRAGVEVSYRRFLYTHFIMSRHSRIDPLFAVNEYEGKVMDINNYSLLLGYGIRLSEKAWVIGYSGLSAGQGHCNGKLLYVLKVNGIFSNEDPVYEEIRYQYVALPVHLKLMLGGPFAAFSLELYTNIHKHSDYGVVASFCVGKIAREQPPSD